MMPPPMAAAATALARLPARQPHQRAPAASRSAAATRVELAREFGTPAYVVAEDDLRARARAFVDALRRAHATTSRSLFASKAFPCTAVLRCCAEEGLGVRRRRPAASCASRCAPASTRRGSTCTATRSPRAELREARRRRRRPRRDRQPRRDRPARASSSPDGARQRGAAARHARRQRRHAPAISTGGPTRSSASTCDAAPRRDRARRRPPTALELAGLHMHIGSQILDARRRSARRSRRSPTLGDFPMLQPRRRPRRRLHRRRATPPAIEEYVDAKVGAVRDAPRAPASGSSTSRAARWSPTRRVTLYTVESVKRNVSTWVAVDGGMSDNLRPMLYGARYEAQVADRFGGGDAAATSSASTASPAT